MTSLVRFVQGGTVAWGTLHADAVTVLAVEGCVYGEWRPGAPVGSLAELDLLPPCEPKVIAALAYNYKDLVGPRNQYEEPLVFLKAPTCVIPSTEAVRVPSWVDRVWVEVELAIVVGRPIFSADRDEAARAILGYTIANDVTASNICGRDHHLARSKSLPTFCPVGDLLRRPVATSSLAMTTTINGRRTQCGTTTNRILDDIDALVLVSRIVALQPGDLVLTGTPAGAMDSIIRPGDRVELAVESIGNLSNPIVGSELG